MKKAVSALVLLAGISIALQRSVPAKSNFMVYGMGMTPCPRYLLEHDDKAKRLINLVWVEGFVTGLNVVSTKTNDVLKGHGPELLDSLLVEYCRKHPLAQLSTAAMGAVVTIQNMK